MSNVIIDGLGQYIAALTAAYDRRTKAQAAVAVFVELRRKETAPSDILNLAAQADQIANTFASLVKR
jgi:hypothetical protein